MKGYPYLVLVLLLTALSCTRRNSGMELPVPAADETKSATRTFGAGTGTGGMSDSPLAWESPVALPAGGFDIVHSSQDGLPSVAAFRGNIAIADGSRLVLSLSGGKAVSRDCGSSIVSGPLFAGKGEVWVALESSLRAYPADVDDGRPPLSVDLGFRPDFMASDPSGCVYAASGDGFVASTGIDGVSLRWKTKLPRDITCLMVRERTVLVGSGDGVVALGADSGIVTAESGRGLSVKAMAAGNDTVAIRLANGELRLLDSGTLGEKPGTSAKDVSAGPVFSSGSFLYASGSSILSCSPDSGNTALVADMQDGVTFLGIGGKDVFGVAANSLFVVSGDVTERSRFSRSRPVHAAPDGKGGIVVVTDSFRVWKGGEGPAIDGQGSAFDGLFMPPPGMRERIGEKAVSYSGATDGRMGEALFDVYSGPAPLVLGEGYSVFAFVPGESRTFSVTIETPGPKPRVEAAPGRGCPAFVSLFGDQGDELKSNVDELGLEYSFNHPFEIGRTYWILIGPAYGGAKGATVVLKIR